VQTLSSIPRGNLQGQCRSEGRLRSVWTSLQKCRITGPVGYGVDCSALSPSVYIKDSPSAPKGLPRSCAAKNTDRTHVVYSRGTNPSTRFRFCSATPFRSQRVWDMPPHEDCQNDAGDYFGAG
jgi:hypothetical protein